MSSTMLTAYHRYESCLHAHYIFNTLAFLSNFFLLFSSTITPILSYKYSASVVSDPHYVDHIVNNALFHVFKRAFYVITLQKEPLKI